MQPDTGRGENTPRAQLKEKLSEHVDQAYRSPSPGNAPPSAFYVFFSFDLVDATRYKEVDPDGWPFVISRFYELIIKNAEKRLGSAMLWKLAGDEVLLYRRIRTIDELQGCLPGAHAILTDTIQRVHRDFPRTNPLLSVKATAWCARVHHVAPQELAHAQQEFTTNGYRNILVPQLGTSDLRDTDHVDFLGPEIDVGFRISKFVSRRRLVVSAELAYLLYRERSKRASIEDELKIVTYELLKGIWEGRRYPIIWYEPRWDDARGTFEYDEQYSSEIVRRIQDDETDEIRRLDRIYRDRNKGNEIEALYDYVAALQPDKSENEPMLIPAARAPQVEVHCVAIGFRRKDDRALLARRPYTKNRFAGQWEFGCGQVGPGEGFDDALIRAYREDFGAELSFPGGLQPVAAYEISDDINNLTIPGIIFLAEITNPDEVKNYRHEEVEWVNPEDPNELPPVEGCVPDLRGSLLKAATVWRGLTREGQQSKVA